MKLKNLNLLIILAIIDLAKKIYLRVKAFAILIVLVSNQLLQAELAVIIKPVIDFTYLPITPNQKVPICPVKVGDDAISCPRIHQGLFNEIVDIIRTENQQVLVAVKNCYFQTNQNLEKQAQFWTSSKNLLPLRDLGTQQSQIPAPIDYNQPNSLYNEQVITLIAPYHSTTTDQIYSAGTRFILVPDSYNNSAIAIHDIQCEHDSENFSNSNSNSIDQPNTSNLSSAPETGNHKNNIISHYQVYIYDPSLNKIIIDQIDQKLCLKLSEDLLDFDHQQHRQLFVTILKQWLNHPIQLSAGPFTIEELTTNNSKHQLTSHNKIKSSNSSNNKPNSKSKKIVSTSNSNSKSHKSLGSKNTVIKRYIQPRPIAPFIPYVWGGCSYTTLCTDPYFQLKTVRSKYRPHAKPRRYFEYPTCHTQPYNGFDCAGLILRAAQASGIPYFYKNTATILQNLEPLQPEDQIANGDLIWLPAHIMVISDVEQNLCIEARHYAQGYGKVHETSIHKIFKDINNYQDLREAHFSQNLIDRLNRHQKSAQKVKIKILKLKTVI